MRFCQKIRRTPVAPMRRAASVFSALSWAACGLLLTLPDETAAQQLNVSVTVRDPIAPPPDAKLVVLLLDAAGADQPWGQMSSQSYKLNTVPSDVALQFDPALIDASKRYLVVAKIMVGPDVVFHSDKDHPVLTQGAGREVSLVLKAAPPQGAQTSSPTSILGRDWRVVELAGSAPTVERPPMLELTKGRRFAFFTGCNMLTGTLQIEAGALLFPPNFSRTLNACTKSEAIFEKDLLTEMPRVTAYALDGKQLSLLDASGAQVMRLGLVFD